ncbi:cupin domain-containing protein [Haladaptatus halobius]|uniref:cupin domain-containing protein n=1 Tax=Haladaptatus halobius TaxID=2884875 RepID=UPI001D0B0B85|nr:cupin domain-containing protein [Haladaptatus halobius]
MEHVTIDAIDPFTHPTGATSGGRALSEALGTTDVALNQYDLAPGESTSGGYHTHLDQEEIFYVLSGTMTFQTDAGEIEVSAGEAIRFAPGDYQHGTNQTSEQVTVLAIGAPDTKHDWDQIRVPIPCSECDADALGVEFASEGETRRLVCPDCGTKMDIPN